MRKQVVIYGRDPIGSEFARRWSRKKRWLVEGLFEGSDRIEHRRDRRRIRPGVRAVLYLARRHRADLIVVRSLRDVEMTPCIVRRLIRSLARRRSGFVALAEDLGTATASDREVDKARHATRRSSTCTSRSRRRPRPVRRVSRSYRIWRFIQNSAVVPTGNSAQGVAARHFN